MHHLHEIELGCSCGPSHNSCRKARWASVLDTGISITSVNLNFPSLDLKMVLNAVLRGSWCLKEISRPDTASLLQHSSGAAPPRHPGLPQAEASLWKWCKSARATCSPLGHFWCGGTCTLGTVARASAGSWEAGMLWEGWVAEPRGSCEWSPVPGGNNLPFQCCPTSGVLATQSCSAEYFVAFLICTCQILAVI